MEIQLNFVLFEELQEKASGSEAVARIMIVRESKNADVALEEGTTGRHPLD
jgi:hypothetical protein